MYRQVARAPWNGNKYRKISCPLTSHAFKIHPNVCSTLPRTTVKSIKYLTFDSFNQVIWLEFDFVVVIQTLNKYISFRHTYWSGVRMFCLLEGSNDQRYMGIEFHIADGCQTIQGMLRKSTCSIDINFYFCFSFPFPVYTILYFVEKQTKAFSAWLGIYIRTPQLTNAPPNKFINRSHSLQTFIFLLRNKHRLPMKNEIN